MSAHRTITISCDGINVPAGGDPIRDSKPCREVFSDVGVPQSNTDVRKAARKAGWACGGFDYCPTHKELYR